MSPRDRIQPFPVLLAFAAFLCGVLAAGLLGGAHAFALAGLGCGLLAAIAWLRRVPAPASIWPLAVLFALGALRLETQVLRDLRPVDWPVEAVRTGRGSSDRVSVEVRVDDVMRRDRQATHAQVHVLAFLRDGRRDPAPAGLRAHLRGPGTLPLLQGGTYAVRVRIRAPRAGPDTLNLRWPGSARWPMLSVSDPKQIVPLAGAPAPSRLDAMRYDWTARILNAVRGDAGDFLCAVLLGEGHGIAADLRQDLSRLGTAHILAVSGLHVAIAATLASFCLIRLAAPVLLRVCSTVNLALLRVLLTALSAVAVAGLAGATPSACRAAGMCVAAAIARLGHRRLRLEACVALTGLLDLTVWPAHAFTWSFLLSYAAVLGIALFARAWTPRWVPEIRRSERFAARLAVLGVQGLCVSTAACVATTPLTLVAFGTAGIAAPIANLVVLPVLEFLVMPFAFAALLAAVAAPDLLVQVAPWVERFFETFLSFQRTLAGLVPDLDAPVSRFLLPLSLAALAGLGVRAIGFRSRAAGVVAVAILTVGCWRFDAFRARPDSLAVTFLDVGKGDAILVQCPTGRRYLVDTGEARAFPRLLRALNQRAIGSLDGLLLTHGDEDHLGGAATLVRTMRVRSVRVPCPELRRDPLRGLVEDFERRGVAVSCVGVGQEALPGCGAESYVLWPPVFAQVSSNAASLVVRLQWEGHSVLLTGDLESPEEQVLIANSPLRVQSDVLKLGHHGSTTSSSSAFLDAVQPRLAVVSGHASRVRRTVPRATLERVAESGAWMRATEDEGNLTVSVHRDRITIESDRSPPVTIPPRRSHGCAGFECL